MGPKTQPEKKLFEIGPVAPPEMPQAPQVPRKYPQRTSSGLSAFGTPIDFGCVTALGGEREKCCGNCQNCGGFWKETAGLGNFWAETGVRGVWGVSGTFRVRALFKQISGSFLHMHAYNPYKPGLRPAATPAALRRSRTPQRTVAAGPGKRGDCGLWRSAILSSLRAYGYA